MSKEKIKSPEVKAFEIQIENLKEDNKKLSALSELLQTEKVLRGETIEELNIAEEKIGMIKEWAAGFERFGDSEYKGSFISEEISKVLKKEKTSDSDDKL